MTRNPVELKAEDPTAFNRWMEQLGEKLKEVEAAVGISGTSDPLASYPPVTTPWVPKPIAPTTYPAVTAPYPGMFSGIHDAKPGPDVETLIDARIDLVVKTMEKLAEAMLASKVQPLEWDHEKMLDRAMEIVYDSMQLAREPDL